MQNTNSNLNSQEKIISSNINNFFDKFEINNILNQASIRKIKGFKVRDIIINITELPFKQKNFYQGIVKNKDIEFNKSVAYDLLNNSKYNWRLFLYKIVAIILNVYFVPLKKDKNQNVLILDDTSHPRNSSKKVELLAKVYDHVFNKYFKGFRIMTMGWSDGNSFIPVDFALLSSNTATNRYQEINPNIDKRSCGYKRRKEAISKSTDLIVPMIKRILRRGIKAKYLLMDSWYGLPAIIRSVKPLIDVICRVKDTPKIYYYQGGKAVTLSQIYRKMKKYRGKANIKGSETVEVINCGVTIPVKIVYVKNRNEKKKWIGILSTDITLSDEEIVRIYGKRWDIEVFFKTIKQFLNLNKEIELRSYDGMIAHISIVMLRYIFLSVEQRKSVDDKTLGGLFLEMIEEMKDITIFEALNRILVLVFEQIRELDDISKETIDKIFDIFMGVVIKKYNLKLLTA
jgi:hypothetical protein